MLIVNWTLVLKEQSPEKGLENKWSQATTTLSCYVSVLSNPQMSCFMGLTRFLCPKARGILKLYPANKVQTTHELQAPHALKSLMA